jgi:hypothetical protein
MPKKLTARNRAFANAQLRRMAENAAVTAPARSNSDLYTLPSFIK